MSRIFISTPGHLKTVHMGRYCAETLRGMGHEVQLFDAGSLTLGEKLVLRPIAKLKREHAFSKTRLNARLLAAVKKFKPELYLSIFGFDILPETIHAIHDAGIRTACWWLNDPFQFDRGLKIAKDYEFFFTNCQASAARYVHEGVAGAFYLPHGAFVPVHKPIVPNESDKRRWGSEVCFVGDWGPVRQGILSILSKNIDFKIWGPWKKHLSPKDRLWNRVVDGYFTPEQMVRIFSSTRIAINLHSWFGYYNHGLNPRTFEAPACGAMQICDWKEDLPQHFLESSEIVTFRTGSELESKLKFLLKDEITRNDIRERGLRRIQRDHLYEKRMALMLERIGR
jgi:spore maturation protein CgeB